MIRKFAAILAALIATTAALVGLTTSSASAAPADNVRYDGRLLVVATSYAPLPQTLPHDAVSLDTGASANGVVSLTPGVCTATLAAVTHTHAGNCQMRFHFAAGVDRYGHPVPAFNAVISVLVISVPF